MAKKTITAVTDLIGADEAGRMIGVDGSMVRRYARIGSLASLRVGRDWLFRRADVAKFKRPPLGRPKKLAATS